MREQRAILPDVLDALCHDDTAGSTRDLMPMYGEPGR